MKHIILYLPSLLLLFSCHLDKKEKIPAYIRIVQAKLITNEQTQGKNTHKITDIWINIDTRLQGIYEIPTIFPVLETGKRHVTIRAGIKDNGIAASRVIFPFFNKISFDTILAEQEIINLTPCFTYKSETKFAWIENFELNGHTLEKMPESDTILFISPEDTSNKVGKIIIDAIKQRFYYKSSHAFSLPKDGSPVYLEVDYKCNHPFTIGIIANKLQNSIVQPYITINPHPSSFNHIYINLTHCILNHSDAIDFNIFFRATLQSGYNYGKIELDNIKLLHF
ncbi:MAG: hypothetical protein N3A01_03000 [Bacteroidales bacterium]|nr:hypothetical protein [Bacteroidales bacterium]